MASPTDIRLDGSVLNGATVNATLNEASQSGLLIGRLSASDTDADESFVFTLTNDAGGAVFLDGNQLRLTEGALLDASQPNLTVTVRAEDSTGNRITRTLVLAVSDEATYSVIRGGSGADDLASVTAGRQYLLGGAGDDTITADSQDVVVLSGRRSDYEITVTTTGGGDPYGGDGYGGGGDPLQHQITLTDLRAGGPDGTDLVLDAGTFRFADGDYSLAELNTPLGTGLALDGRVLDEAKYLVENAAIGFEVGQLSIQGLGGAPVVTTLEVLGYSGGAIFPDTLTGAANPFAIAADGTISVTGAVNYEDYESFTLRVFYQDAGGNSYFDLVNITTLDADDAPRISSAPGRLSPVSIGNYVDTSQNVLVGALATQDEDGSTGTVSYVLGGADADKFVVQGGQLFLRAGAEVDTGAPFDFDLTVRAQDSSLPPGSGTAVDLDIRVSTPDPLDSLRWDYTAPATIRVYLAPGGMLANEIATLDDDVAPQGSYATLGWSAEQASRIEAAFAAFSDVLNVTFSFVTDLANADFAMLLSQDSAPNSSAYWAVGGGTLALDGGEASLDGWGRFGLSQLGSAEFAPGSFEYYVMLHEIAHGLGMAHPHDTGGGSVVMEGVEDEVDSYGAFDLNQAPFTIMSYNEQWETGPLPIDAGDDLGRLASLGALDIAVLQSVYGANTSVRTGNDSYDLPLVAATGSRFLTIWDAGGQDTLRYTGIANATISLQAATLGYSATGGGVVSFVEGIAGGFTIAAGAVIENASGGRGDDRITGNTAANRLAGGGGADTVNGGAGNDTLIGSAGRDSLIGGSGNDVFVIDNTNDRADGGAGMDTVQSAVSFNLDANESVRLVERLTLTGTGNINGTGNALDNVLTGNGGNNVLDGGLGNDTLIGGAGNDAFVFDTALGGGNVDRITDFNVVDDRIRLDDAIFAGLATGVLAASAFAANLTGKAGTASERIIYETDTGRLFYDSDGVGGAGRLQFATLTTGLTLKGTDFLVF